MPSRQQLSTLGTRRINWNFSFNWLITLIKTFHYAIRAAVRNSKKLISWNVMFRFNWASHRDFTTRFRVDAAIIWLSVPNGNVYVRPSIKCLPFNVGTSLTPFISFWHLELDVICRRILFHGKLNFEKKKYKFIANFTANETFSMVFAKLIAN